VNKRQPQQHISKCTAFFHWKQMSKEAQGIWETIPDSDKTIILNASAPNNTYLSNNPKRSIYLHESDYVNDTDNADDGIDALMMLLPMMTEVVLSYLLMSPSKSHLLKHLVAAILHLLISVNYYLLTSLVLVLMVPTLFHLNSM
jgi:hypothetical protein